MCQFGLLRSLLSTSTRLDKQTKWETSWILTSPERKLAQQSLGSETFDTDLGIVYSKSGLDSATTDKFAKQNCVKINNNNGRTEFSWLMFTMTKLLNYIQKLLKFTSYCPILSKWQEWVGSLRIMSDKVLKQDYL